VFTSLRSRLTFANVTSVVALFVALGGTAAGASYVISRNGQLGPGTVSGSNPPKGKHDNVIASSITGNDVKPGSIGGKRILDRSLTESDLASGAIAPYAYGATLAKSGVPTCQSANNCPLQFNKRVTSVTQIQFDNKPTGAYCIGIQGATPAKRLMIAGLRSHQGNAFPTPQAVGANCPDNKFEIDVTNNGDAQSETQSRIPFWFAVL
jgi:hypothetical protein